MINKLKNILKKDKVFLMMALIIAALDSCVPTRDLKAESTKSQVVTKTNRPTP